MLGSRNPASTELGGFLGYNVEWESVILGGGMNYNHVSLTAASSGALTRRFTDSGNLPAGHHYFYTLDVAGQSACQHDRHRHVPRPRIGWQAGNFLPYVFAGLAVGRGNTSSSCDLSLHGNRFS